MRRTFILCVLMAFALFVIFAGLVNDKLSGPALLPAGHSSAFNKYTNSIFFNNVADNAFNLHFYFKNPGNYDISCNNYSLGTVSLKDMKASSKSYLRIIDDLNHFDYNNLSDNEKLTYDILRYHACNELDFADLCINYQPLSPTIGIQAQLPVLLSQYSLNNEEDVISYLKTLSSIGSYFDSIIAFEKAKCDAGCFMSRKTLSEIVSQCSDFANSKECFLISTFDERINRIKLLKYDKKVKYKILNRQVVNNIVLPSYKRLADNLNSMSSYCSPHLGLSQFETGKEYYQYLVRQTTGSDKTVPAIEVMLSNQLDKDLQVLRSVSNNPDVAAALSGASSSTPSHPKKILHYLIGKMTKDFPSAATTNFKLMDVPESLGPHLSPAFYLSPPIDDIDNNVIFINKAFKMSNTDLFITLAHEGFPGHLYQTTYFSEKSPSLIRHLLNFGGYSEGWATYSELYAYNYLYKDTTVRDIMISDARYSFALYCLADIGINYHGWTFNDTVDFFKKYSISDIGTITSIYDGMIANPGNNLQYYVGYLEFVELKKYMKTKLGKSYSPLVFHTFVLENGPAPFSILKKYIKRTLITK